MLQEQALLLRYQLHLDGIDGQQFVQGVGHGQCIFLHRLYPECTEALWLTELRFGQLCQAKQLERSIFAFLELKHYITAIQLDFTRSRNKSDKLKKINLFI